MTAKPKFCTANLHWIDRGAAQCACGALAAVPTERYWIPAGTVIHIKGIPVTVLEHTTIEVNKANWEGLVKPELEFPPLADEPVLPPPPDGQEPT